MRLIHKTLLCSLAAAGTLIPAPCRADSTSAPTPAPPSTSVSAEDEYSPSYQGESGSSNLIDLRAQIPYDNSAWVLRLKLPIVTAAPSASLTGAGDLSLWDLAVLNVGQGQWLLGPTLRIPIGNDTLGTHKYSAGPSFGYIEQRGGHTYLAFGFFAQSFFSVIGPSWYPGVSKTQIAPVLKIVFPSGVAVGLSAMQFTYDWVINRWTDVPVGLRVGKKPLSARLSALDAYFEAERNLVHTPDTPGWTIRGLFRWRFFGPQNAPTDSDQDQ